MQSLTMHPCDLERAAPEVLACYPTPLGLRSPVALGNLGGFSGAALFRIGDADGALCLRAWPLLGPGPERLTWIHHRMQSARGAGLSFVPRVFPTSDGRTFVANASRLWELQEWLPGSADFHERPSVRRLENAAVALAALHSAWDRTAGTTQPCPAVRRRVESLRRWDAFAPTTPGDAVTDPTLHAVAQRARGLLPRWQGQVRPWLEPWGNRPLALHACLCDVWHDHVLFTGDQVTGVIDYGAVKVDNAAVDLARMLGSLVGDDEPAWQAALAAYRSVRALSCEEEQLARVLDVTGTVLGVANWLMRLAVEKRTAAEQEAVARRLETLVRRVAEWETKMPLAAER